LGSRFLLGKTPFGVFNERTIYDWIPDGARTTSCIYLGIATRGQKYNSEFRFGGWKFQETLHIRRPTTLKTIDLASNTFFRFISSKNPFVRPAAVPVYWLRYVAYDPDKVVDAHWHNRHTNYCLAWALSEPQEICSRPTARKNNRLVGLSFYVPLLVKP